MRHGDKEAWLREVEAETGQSFRVLREKPELPGSLHKFLEAFFYLTTERAVHIGGVGPIPLTALDAYLRLFRITDRDEIEDYLFFLRAMDRVFLQEQADRREQKDV